MDIDWKAILGEVVLAAAEVGEDEEDVHAVHDTVLNDQIVAFQLIKQYSCRTYHSQQKFVHLLQINEYDTHNNFYPLS